MQMTTIICHIELRIYCCDLLFTIIVTAYKVVQQIGLKDVANLKNNSLFTLTSISDTTIINTNFNYRQMAEAPSLL